MSRRPPVRLRRLVEVNPATREFSLVAENQDVTFLPLEAIWPGARLDVSRVRPKREVEVGYTRFREGDILLPKITPTFEADRTVVARGLRNGFGCGTTELHVLRPRREVELRYLKYILSSKPFLSEGEATMLGVAGQKRVPESFLLNYEAHFPEITEQRAIADVLDAETARIDALLTSRLRTRALLEERMRTVASTVLTGSASFYGATHESSDACAVVSLGRVATIQTGLTVDDARASGSEPVTRPYLRVANVQDGYLSIENLTMVSVPAALAARCELRPGDVLMTEGGDLDKLGRGTVWPGSVPGCLHQNHVFAVRAEPDLLDPLYLALLTTTHHARAYFESTGTRTTNLASTNAFKIAMFPIPLPPLPRQRQLVARVQGELELSAKAGKVVTGQTALLRERRRALITAAVTGQIDVTRGAA